MNTCAKAHAGYAASIAVVVLFAFFACRPGERGGTAVRDELEIMTINVWSGLDYKGTLRMGEYEAPQRREARYQALLQEVKRLSPDVVGINEANFLPDYVKRLSADLGYDYIYHVGVAGLHVGRVGIPWNLKEGDALLAKKDLGLARAGRKQLSGGGFVWNCLSFHTQDATQVLAGRIRVNGRDVYLAVTHWHASPANDESSVRLLKKLKDAGGYTELEYQAALEKLTADWRWREAEARDMAAYLKTLLPAGAPVIAMGDFNAEIDSPEMRYFLGQGYRDSFSAAGDGKGYTWDAGRNDNIRRFYLSRKEKRFDSLYEYLDTINVGKSKRIDFILPGAAFPAGAVRRSSVCCAELRDGVHPSDHFGVFSVVSLR